jgi:7 transmembrane receptor (rhodopsin family).
MMSRPCVLRSTHYVTGLISISAFIINFLVLALINSKSRKLLKCCTNMILTSLAFTDLVTGGVGTLIFAAYIYRVEYSCKRTLKIQPYPFQIVKFCLLNSIFHLVLLATERLISIYRPLRHRVIVTKRRTVPLIVLCWIISIVLSVTERYVGGDDLQYIFYAIFLLIPTAILMTQYLIMLLIIFRYTKTRNELANSNIVVNKQKPCLIYLVMFICFLLLGLPSFVVLNYDRVYGNGTLMRNHMDVLEVLGVLRMLPSLLNPFIYSFSKEDFQSELGKLVRRTICWRKIHDSRPIAGSSRALFKVDRGCCKIKNIRFRDSYNTSLENTKITSPDTQLLSSL